MFSAALVDSRLYPHPPSTEPASFLRSSPHKLTKELFNNASDSFPLLRSFLWNPKHRSYSCHRSVSSSALLFSHIAHPLPSADCWECDVPANEESGTLSQHRDGDILQRASCVQPVNDGSQDLVNNVARHSGTDEALAAQAEDAERAAVAQDRDVAEIDKLPHGLNKQMLPKHVAIIMDGNSRWAQKRGSFVSVGHETGVGAVKEVVKLSHEWGIQALTLFAFSADNWFRPKVEVNFLMNLFEKVLREELANFVKLRIRMHVIGDVTSLPESLQRLITLVEKTTDKNTGLKLTVAVCYTGRHDIVRACQQVALEVEKGLLKAEDISESLLDDKLSTSWMGEIKNPDLLIRTSGDQRLSNFLLWQLAYTELFFVDSCWPEFGETHYADALLSFQQRERRFGRRSNVHEIKMTDWI